MDNDLKYIIEIDRLVHEPMRLFILALLNTIESADYLYLLRETGTTKGNLTSHIAKLEEAGYILVHKTYRGKIPQTIYSLTEDGRLAFTTYLKNMRQFLDTMGV